MSPSGASVPSSAAPGEWSPWWEPWPCPGRWRPPARSSARGAVVARRVHGRGRGLRPQRLAGWPSSSGVASPVAAAPPSVGLPGGAVVGPGRRLRELGGLVPCGERRGVVPPVRVRRRRGRRVRGVHPRDRSGQPGPAADHAGHAGGGHGHPPATARGGPCDRRGGRRCREGRQRREPVRRRRRRARASGRRAAGRVRRDRWSVMGGLVRRGNAPAVARGDATAGTSFVGASGQSESGPLSSPSVSSPWSSSPCSSWPWVPCSWVVAWSSGWSAACVVRRRPGPRRPRPGRRHPPAPAPWWSRRRRCPRSWCRRGLVGRGAGGVLAGRRPGRQRAPWRGPRWAGPSVLVLRPRLGGARLALRGVLVDLVAVLVHDRGASGCSRRPSCCRWRTRRRSEVTAAMAALAAMARAAVVLRMRVTPRLDGRRRDAPAPLVTCYLSRR